MNIELSLQTGKLKITWFGQQSMSNQMCSNF